MPILPLRSQPDRCDYTPYQQKVSGRSNWHSNIVGGTIAFTECQRRVHPGCWLASQLTHHPHFVSSFPASDLTTRSALSVSHEFRSRVTNCPHRFIPLWEEKPMKTLPNVLHRAQLVAALMSASTLLAQDRIKVEPLLPIQSLPPIRVLLPPPPPPPPPPRVEVPPARLAPCSHRLITRVDSSGQVHTFDSCN
jgi:hypothetical protein